MLNHKIRQTVDSWLHGNYDQATKNEIMVMINNADDREAEDAFYKNLEFGTGGLRGIMGVGTNRMNIYTVSMATQGLSNYIIKQYGDEGKQKGVAVAYDSRNNSKVFAEKTCEILSSNGIKAYIYDDIKPIALLSFAVRHLSCIAGIVITASHNPKEYNGYKVFWTDGAQVVSPNDIGIIDEVNKVSIENVKKGDTTLVSVIDKSVEESYFENARKLVINEHAIKEGSDVKIVYTPLHGSGYKVVPEFLSRLGFKNVYSLSSIQSPNGNFPTVPTPNPENPVALEMAIVRAKETGSEIAIGTDPDCDRVGMAIRMKDGEYKTLTGNQIATFLLYYLLSSKKENNTLTADMYVVKSIVTTNILYSIAKDYGVQICEVLTGFKWIAETIKNMEKENPNKKFIFGCEESHGYLFGDFVRDKDGVSSSAIIAEFAAYCKVNGIKVCNYIENIYRRYGYYFTDIVSIDKKGVEGARKIANMMRHYRDNPPIEIAGIPLVSYTDYLERKHYKSDGKLLGNVMLPKSDVMQYALADGSIISIRPSGTEPKIKFYFEARIESNDMLEAEGKAKEKIEMFKSIIL